MSDWYEKEFGPISDEELAVVEEFRGPVTMAREILALRLRYKAASGLALSWGNYADRSALEREIGRIVADPEVLK